MHNTIEQIINSLISLCLFARCESFGHSDWSKVVAASLQDNFCDEWKRGKVYKI